MFTALERHVQLTFQEQTNVPPLRNQRSAKTNSGRAERMKKAPRYMGMCGQLFCSVSACCSRRLSIAERLHWTLSFIPHAYIEAKARTRTPSVTHSQETNKYVYKQRRRAYGRPRLMIIIAHHIASHILTRNETGE